MRGARKLRNLRKLNCAICAIPPETKNNSEDAKLSQAKGRIQTGVTLADASRMATLCEPSQAPKYGLKYGPAHAKKDKPATGAGLRGICGGETVRLKAEEAELWRTYQPELTGVSDDRI